MRNPRTALLDEADGYLQSRQPYAAVAPTDWTPGEVARRLVEAADVLRRQRGRVGPKAYGSNWPSIVQDEQIKSEASSTADPPGMEEISRMEEAIHWPAKYLGYVIDADAVTFWATCVAHKVPIVAHVKARVAQAVKEQEEESARRAVRRRAKAKAVAAWANEQMQGADHAKAGAIKAEAADRLRAACKDLMPIEINTDNPNRAMSKSALYRHMNYAIDAICEKLLEKRVPFRAVPQDEEPEIRTNRAWQV